MILPTYDEMATIMLMELEFRLSENGNIPPLKRVPSMEQMSELCRACALLFYEPDHV